MAHRMSKIEIAALHAELVAANVNPSMEDVKVGDAFITNQTYTFGGNQFSYITSFRKFRR